MANINPSNINRFQQNQLQPATVSAFKKASGLKKSADKAIKDFQAGVRHYEGLAGNPIKGTTFNDMPPQSKFQAIFTDQQAAGLIRKGGGGLKYLNNALTGLKNMVKKGTELTSEEKAFLGKINTRITARLNNFQEPLSKSEKKELETAQRRIGKILSEPKSTRIPVYDQTPSPVLYGNAPSLNDGYQKLPVLSKDLQSHQQRLPGDSPDNRPLPSNPEQRALPQTPLESRLQYTELPPESPPLKYTQLPAENAPPKPPLPSKKRAAPQRDPQKPSRAAPKRRQGNAQPTVRAASAPTKYGAMPSSIHSNQDIFNFLNKPHSLTGLQKQGILNHIKDKSKKDELLELKNHIRPGGYIRQVYEGLYDKRKSVESSEFLNAMDKAIADKLKEIGNS